ncbi:hypothetical protein C8Q78DRAFT_809642 [Trametes maxima]|nr:hypothetical protein C8Q78DRAFT_809642 [Trametes maxima]
MWGRRFTWSKTIFLLNRYSAIILGLLLWVEMVLPTEICGIIRSIASAVFSGTLIYAISYRNAPITSVVVFLGMAPVLARIFLVSRGRFNISIPLPGEEMGCLIVLDLPPRAAMIRCH